MEGEGAPTESANFEEKEPVGSGRKLVTAETEQVGWFLFISLLSPFVTHSLCLSIPISSRSLSLTRARFGLTTSFAPEESKAII